MTALRLVGPGMTPTAVADEASMELAAHNDEALRFVERARSHARQVEHASRGERPDIHRHAVSLLGLLTGYERRHIDDDEPVAA